MQVRKTVRDDPQPRPTPEPRPCPRRMESDDYLAQERYRYYPEEEYCEPEEPVVTMAKPKVKKSKPKTKRRKPKAKAKPRNGKYRTTATTFKEDDGSYSPYPPNAFVIRGPQGTPVACDYDENGVPTDNGMEISQEGWLNEVCSEELGMRGTAVVLAHVVKGDSTCLVKALQVNDIEYNGRPMTVKQMAKDGKLLEIATALRASYVEEIS